MFSRGWGRRGRPEGLPRLVRGGGCSSRPGGPEGRRSRWTPSPHRPKPRRGVGLEREEVRRTSDRQTTVEGVKGEAFHDCSSRGRLNSPRGEAPGLLRGSKTPHQYPGRASPFQVGGSLRGAKPPLGGVGSGRGKAPPA